MSPPRVASERTLCRHRLYGAPLNGPGADAATFPPHEAWPDDMQLRIGTSGWAYDHWRGRFYPRALPPRDWLAFAARRLPTVEVNATWRRLPAPHVFDSWRERAPPGFQLTLKAPREITHDRRLVGTSDATRAFLAQALRLQDALGVILFQFPGSFREDLPLLARFLDELPRGLRYAVELRHRSWFARETYELLAEHAVAFVVHDFARKGSPIVETAPFCYLRLHGPTGRYRGGYDTETLLQWSEQVRDWTQRGFEVYVYFNNDERAKSLAGVARLRDALADTTAADAAARAAPLARGRTAPTLDR